MVITAEVGAWVLPSHYELDHSRSGNRQRLDFLVIVIV